VPPLPLGLWRYVYVLVGRGAADVFLPLSENFAAKAGGFVAFHPPV
jgi:hypothetical protein